VLVHPQPRLSTRRRGALLAGFACLSLMAATTIDVAGASASTEPPPIVVRNPHNAKLVVGQSHTFTAIAEYASTAVWEVSTDGGSTWSTYGTPHNSTLRDGDLKSRLPFGPFSASESGWELRAGFVNDPCGLPSCIQVNGSTPATVTLRARSGG
jgi:hypothetical protein